MSMPLWLRSVVAVLSVMVAFTGTHLVVMGDPTLGWFALGVGIALSYVVRWGLDR